MDAGRINQAEFIMAEEREVFYEEPNVFPYFITPASLVSFLFSPFIAYLVNPLFWRIFLPANKNPPRSDVYFHTMLGSTIHAIVASSLTCYLMAFGLMGSNCVFSKSPLGFAIM